MEKEEKKTSFKINLWQVLTIVFLAAFLISAYFNFTGKFIFTFQNPQEIGKKVIDYINARFVRPGTSASLKDVKFDSNLGLYVVTTEYQGNEIPVYVSSNGRYLIAGYVYIFDLGETTTPSQQTSQSASRQSKDLEALVNQTIIELAKRIPKRDVPDLKLFVMSYCPFGLQAERALLPVMKLLGNKANISIHFVYYAMHEDKEVYENLRQYCIQKEQKEKFYDYLLCFVQSGDYSKCLDEAKIDKTSLERCMDKVDKEYNVSGKLKDKSTWYCGPIGCYPPFDVELELNKKYNVGGSPTLIINDIVVEEFGYSYVRSPEFLKRVICISFNNPPKECDEKLSLEPLSPGFGSLSQTSSTTAATGSCG